MRLHTTGIDARRGAQRMVVPFASCATPQVPCCVQTLRAGHALRAWRCCSPLIWNNQTSQLAPSPARNTRSAHIRFLLKQAFSVACFLLVALLPIEARALDYRSVTAGRTVMFDAPSLQAKKLYIVSQYYPVEVIVNLGEWLKVRDRSGELAWLESKSLSTRRTVIVTAARVEAHETAATASAVVFRTEKLVALELIEAGANGWAKVRHRDGLTGYIPAAQVWGL